ncbi:MAG: phosphate ABC transporter substrate-binding protein PstS [Prevotella sp.]|jgi:phosphate transport system substrate-binding protein
MKKRIILVAVLAIIALGLVITILSKNAGSKTISGAGATFPQPFYNAAFITYGHLAHVKVTYGGIGSGGGIRSLKDKVVDFGASDAFLSDKEMNEMPAPVVHIPTCCGAVVIAFNLPGIKQIKLTPDVLAAIFSGKIKNWNSTELKKINSGIHFPNKAIVVIHRSDGSGTTNMFTDYLSKVDAAWRAKIGSGKTVNWPVGIGAKGNPGVAGAIHQTVGSIGYVGSEYAFAQHQPSALVQNKSGNFIEASVASVSAAAQCAIPADTRVMLNNSSAKDAYPIAGFTWLLLYKNQAYNNRSFAQAQATLKLVDWMLDHDAQKIASKVNYAPLAPNVAAKAKAILRTITYNGKRVLK